FSHAVNKTGWFTCFGIRERRKRKPMMEEWSEFASLYGKRFLGSLTNAETGEPVGFVDRMTKEEIRRLSELPTAEAGICSNQR
ncbi:MAG: hypothetical protein ACKO9Q_00275, partial [Pirellula sp.]